MRNSRGGGKAERRAPRAPHARLVRPLLPDEHPPSHAYLLGLGFRRHGGAAATTAATRHELGHAAGADLRQRRVVVHGFKCGARGCVSIGVARWVGSCALLRVLTRSATGTLREWR